MPTSVNCLVQTTDGPVLVQVLTAICHKLVALTGN